MINTRVAELTAQRNITLGFIMSAPVELVLTPHAKTATSAGGWTHTAATDRALQTFRIIDASALGLPSPTKSLDGVERKYDYMLLGEYDAVVGVGDTFTYDGRAHEVIELMFNLEYEVRAKVVRHG